MWACAASSCAPMPSRPTATRGRIFPHRRLPARTRGGDVGVERRLFHDWLSLDATYFRTRFYDLIVILGGSLAKLSYFQSDNLANSLAQGGEFSAKLRPASWIFVNASYTLLKTEILSVDGGPGIAPPPFQVGQELIRRPAN